MSGKGAVAIFVDCSSLWHGAFAWAKGNIKPGGKLRVDYDTLLKLLRKHGNGGPAKAYVTARSGIDVLGFKNALESFGYEVVLVEGKTARTQIEDEMRAVKDQKWEAVAIASDDPMLASVVRYAALYAKVHWYAFGLNLEGSHQPHFLGAEVVA